MKNFHSQLVRDHLDDKVHYEVKNNEEYLRKSEALLKEITLPKDALLCNKQRCNNTSHLASITVFAINIVTALLKSGNERTLKDRSTSHNIPGWNYFVQSYHKTAREKYLIWRRMGCPRAGIAYYQMVNTKRDFKRALKVCKNMKNVILRNKTVNDTQRKKPWKTINKIRKKKAKLPVSVNECGICSAGETIMKILWQVLVTLQVT